MPHIIALDEDSRVVSYAVGSDYTADTIVFQNHTNCYLDDFNESDLFKIYNAETDTFTADDQTETLLNPIEPEPAPEEEV